jgi:peptide deformylase
VAVQPIRLFGDPVLRTPAEPVVDFDRQLERLVQDLFDTMHDAPGRGLAAPQIGVGLRVFTYHVSADEHGHLINPELTFPDEEEELGPEGCLSIPELSWDCRRYRNVIACGVDLHGEPVTLTGSGMLARAVQHETDHLDGILFVDRLDAETRKRAMAEIRDAEWGPAPELRVSPHPTFGRAL